MDKVSEILKSARKNKKLTQKELGNKSGFPQGHISKIESGDIDMRVSSLIEVARLLDLELILVPKHLKQVIYGIISGDNNIHKRSAWQPDEEI